MAAMRRMMLLSAGASGLLLASIAGSACGSDAIGSAVPSLPDASFDVAPPDASSTGAETSVPDAARPDAALPDAADAAVATYSIGGTVSGLDAGDTLVVGSGGATHALTANGPFTLPAELPDGGVYAVTIETPPSGKRCTVTNGSGTIAAADVTSVAIACVVSCGDGIVDPGEACDDGNLVDLDACANACTKSPIYLGGNATTFIDNGLALLGEPFVSASGGGSFGAAPPSGVLISSSNGGDPPFPTGWQTFLDAGGHILVTGGSNSDAYRAFIGGFLTVDATTTFHTSGDCAGDWTKTATHPLTALLPQTYDFANPSTSFHMLHFGAAQPAGTTILGRTCHAAGDTGIFAVRSYPSGGTFTYLAFDIGTYTGANTPADFVQPLLDGYLKFVRSKR